MYKSGLIHFYVPLEKNREFLVPGVEYIESLEEEEDVADDEEKKDKWPERSYTSNTTKTLCSWSAVIGLGQCHRLIVFSVVFNEFR